MFASPAHAATGAAGAGGGAPALITSILPFVLIFIIFYLLLIRPQQKRVRQHQDMIAAVKKNDIAVTGGGIVGKVTRVDDAEVELEIAPNVRVKAVKTTLSEVRPHGTKPAND